MMKVLIGLVLLVGLCSCQSSPSAAPTTTATTTQSTEAPVYCPDDWFDANDLGCFKFLESKLNLTWVEAQEECEQVGGYLAEPITTRQAMFLKELAILEASFTGIGYWYIGLTDLGREGEWLWINAGISIEDSLWGTNKPSSKPKNREDCGVMVVKNNQFSWEDHKCQAPDVSNHPVAPVCQLATTASQTTTAAPETTTTPVLQCKADWTEFQGHCYKFSGTSNSYYWTSSDAICLGEGGRLASVHSAEEDQFLQSLANGNNYWMGGYPSDNTWVWSDGTEYDYVGNVYSMDNGECIAYQNGYGWYTYSCTNDGFYYICKI